MPPAPMGGSALAAISSNAQATEVLASIFVAKQFPRDLGEVTMNMNQSCSRMKLAQAARYSYPRGGSRVEGASIRLAEALLSSWGNAEAGWMELSTHWDAKGAKGQGCKVSLCRSYCFDKQTNVRREINFEVPHVRFSRQGATILDDARDVYELCANQASRRIRACILQIIPSWLVDEALERVDETLEKGDKRPLPDKIRSMLAAFASIGVTREQIEKRIAHKAEASSATELVNLGKIYTSIQDGMSSAHQEFPEENKVKITDAPIDTAPAPSPKKKPIEAKFENAQTVAVPVITRKDIVLDDDDKLNPNLFEVDDYAQDVPTYFED